MSDTTPIADTVLEERLGHKFSNRELLNRALTHSSALPELRGAGADTPPSVTQLSDNERFEFLGDAVLELLASEYLLAAFPEWSEGQLSKSRARIVNASSLESAARRLHLGEHLRLGRGEEKTGGREKQTLLADAFEAIVAAVYLDAGLHAARDLLERTLFEQALEERGERISESDRKSALQEFLQGRGQPPAEYRLAGESGPDHQKTFQIEVWINGECLATGEGSTKKEAEQQAARSALEQLERTGVRG
ncbi:MAG TPA: ribonuclease III [Candidatus Dormibacteraeota bacterium]|nr:ribonuclease III [Candidatus Dormibacteraeota bacterium]